MATRRLYGWVTVRSPCTQSQAAAVGGGRVYQETRVLGGHSQEAAAATRRLYVLFSLRSACTQSQAAAVDACRV